MPLYRRKGFAVAAANHSGWAYNFFGGCFWCPCMGPKDLQWQLPIILDGPIISSAGASDALEWAQKIYSGSCQSFWMGLLFLWQVLPMPLDGPKRFAVAAVDQSEWAHNFFSRCFWCPWIGPKDLQWQLLIILNGPIISLADAANALKWAGEICSDSCWSFQIGPLFLSRYCWYHWRGSITFLHLELQLLIVFYALLLRCSSLVMSTSFWRYIYWLQSAINCSNESYYR